MSRTPPTATVEEIVAAARAVQHDEDADAGVFIDWIIANLDSRPAAPPPARKKRRK